MTHTPIRAVSLGSRLLIDYLGEERTVESSTPLARLVAGSSIDFLVVGLDRPVGADDGVAIDASIVASSLLSELDPRIGVLIAAWPGADHPYNLARRALTLDHLSNGRSGVVFPGSRGLDLRFGGERNWVPEAPAQEVVREASEILDQLWSSWTIESFIADQSTGVYVDLDGVRRVNHEGAYSIAGPLTLPTSPQGLPVRAQRVVAGEPLLHGIDLAIVEPGAVAPAPVVIEHLAREAWRADPGRLGDGRSVLVEATDEQDLLRLAELLPVRDEPASGRTLRERLGVPAPVIELQAATPAFIEGIVE